MRCARVADLAFSSHDFQRVHHSTQTYYGMWLVCRLNRLVEYKPVTVGTLVARGMLCCLCVDLDATLQSCVFSLDGCELHVAHCGLCIWCNVGDRLVTLELHRPREHRLVGLGLPNKALYLVGRWRCRSPTSMFCDCVFRFPCGQVDTLLG